MATFTVVSAAEVLPKYNPGGISSSVDTCSPYKDFDYDDPGIILRELVIGIGEGSPGSRLLATYTGDGYKLLNITEFTVVRLSDSTPLTTAAKLYLSGIQVTTFPTVINIEGLMHSDSFGIEIGYWPVPPCVEGDGYKASLYFTITDINGSTGLEKIYYIQVTYNP